VLAAGVGARLRPYTDNLPKTLVPIDGEFTILDCILRNLTEAGITDIAIVVGHAAEAVETRLPSLKERYRADLTLIPNDRPEWNNAYSLWLAREAYQNGALLINGDTVHPVEVERHLLMQQEEGLFITVDSRKTLTDEAMKVRLDPSGRIVQITKQLALSDADGEYIGASLISPGIAADLTSALAATWREDPTRYYEDGYQLFADRGGVIRCADPGPIEWVEVDDHADLAVARALSCRS
jgi:choline kinase